MITSEKKLLCIGDSLALPGHLNRYEDTWFYLLKREFPTFDCLSFFKRQLTTDVLTTMGGGEIGVDKWPKGADCLEAYMPDFVILQLGIVDCAPRLLNTFDKRILKLIPSRLSSSYIRFIKTLRSRKTTNTYTSIEQFRKNWENYLKRTVKNNTKVIIISISLPDEIFLQKNPKTIKNVNIYNDFLLQLGSSYGNVCVTIPLDPRNYNFPIYEDGYHPNSTGNRIIFESVKRLLKDLYE
jgi:lysophospholipase L1-like esterase